MSVYQRVTIKGKRKRLHTILAEKAIGRELRGSEQVHHFDGDRSNNNSNLVICPSGEYHKLLHRRMEALEACGDANKRRCYLCKNWDDTNNMTRVYQRSRNSHFFYHKNCASLHYAANKDRILGHRAHRRSLGRRN